MYFFFSSSSPPSVYPSMWRKSNCGSLQHYIKSQNKIFILCLFSLMAEESSPSSTLKRHPSLFRSYDFGLGWLSHSGFFFFLYNHVSLTRCQSLGRSQTTALGSISHCAGHTRWLLCSRSSTGPRSGCWKPSVYASAAPSDGHLLSRCPPAGTGRCQVYRTCLVRKHRSRSYSTRSCILHM